MLTLYIIFHVVISLILARLILAAKSEYKINITVYNFPGIALAILTMCAAICFGAIYPYYYCFIGLFMSVLSWIFNSTPLENEQPVSLLRKIIVGIVSILLWPEVFIFLLFYFSNLDLMNEKPKP